MPRYIGLVYCKLCGEEHGVYKDTKGWLYFICKRKKKPLKRSMKLGLAQWID